MQIDVVEENNRIIEKITGRIDTTTAGEFEAKTFELIEKTNDLVLDFAELSYISSAGLRVLLSAQKKINQKEGHFCLTNINDFVTEVLDMTGFSDIINVE